MILDIIEKTVIPILTLVLGFLIAQRLKRNDDRLGDKKKLNRLLFNLLEIRHIVKANIDFNGSIDMILHKLLVRYADKAEYEKYQPIIRQAILPVIKDRFIDNEKIEYIEKNIDSIIEEVSEFEPIFAYELNGKYSISRNISSFETDINKYLNHLTNLNIPIPDTTPFVDVSVHTFSKQFQDKLEGYILEIAKKAGSDTYNRIREKFEEKRDLDSITESVYSIMDEIAEKLKGTGY